MAATQPFSGTTKGSTITPMELEYANVDGKSLRLDLYLPENDDSEKSVRPLVVWVHGGAWRSGSKSKVPILEWLNTGFAVASVDYRLSPEAKFPAQVHDLKAAIRYLRAHSGEYNIDPERFVISGASAGAHLAALVGVTEGVEPLEGSVGEYPNQDSSIQAIVSFYGASNLESILTQSTEHGLSVRVPALDLLLGGQPAEKPELARLASPVTHVDTTDPPLWLLHGDADPQMPAEQSQELYAAYQNRQRPVKLELLPGAKHGGEVFYESGRLSRIGKQLIAALEISFMQEGAKKQAKPSLNAGFLDPEMNVEEWLGRFEIESREVYGARNEILEFCEIRPGMRIADVGAGTGFYSRLFSNEVGEDGWVYSVDISTRFLEHINAKSKEAGIKNLTSVLCTDQSVRLPPNSVDLVFICDTYHHFESPQLTLASIRRALKPGGTLVLIDFERIPGESREFILGHVRANKEVFRKEIVDADFRYVEEIEVPGFKENYFLRFRKP